MTKYKTFTERQAARREQVRIAGLKFKEKRQTAGGILPLWKAAAMIEAAIKNGYTFADAWEAVQDIASERGLRVRCDIYNGKVAK